MKLKLLVESLREKPQVSSEKLLFSGKKSQVSSDKSQDAGLRSLIINQEIVFGQSKSGMDR